MSADPDRQAAYETLRQRFLSDPDFRSRFRSDPLGTAQDELGDLSDAERAALAGLDTESDDALVEQVSGKVGAW